MTEVDREVADDTRRHLTHIARGGALGLVGAAVTGITGFLLVLIVTNLYDTQTAGRFFTVTSAFLLLASITSLGTETGLGRFMLRYEAQDRRGDIPPTIRAAFRPTLISSLVIAVVVIAFAGPFADLIGVGGDGGAESMIVLAVTLPLATWQALTLAGTRAFGRMRDTVFVDKIGRPLAQPLLVLLGSLVSVNLLGLTIAWSVPYAVAGLIAAAMFRRFLHRRGTMAHTEPTKSYRELRADFWRFTWPRSITRISQMAIQRMDIILIAAMKGPKDAAIYTAATRFVALGQFGTQAIQQVLQPKFTALLANREHESLKDVYQISAAWSMAVSWPMYVGVAAAPLVYLSLFGQEYVDQGVAVVLLMAGAQLFAVATGPCDTLLLMSGRSALSLANSLLALALDIGLCLLLIPKMGITGAALAWAIAVIARCTLAVIQVQITMKILSFGRAAGVAAVANVLCFAVPIVGVEIFVDLSLLTLIPVVAVCFVLYAFALWWGRRVLMLDVLRGLVRRRRDPQHRSSEDELETDLFPETSADG
ncbi:lipopolysaccharide biosynthesis protein [Marmoricola sp. URHB0036]|uniref:lipopolysaccharide biosynthesis protein n=1 Tax=Marmoricola sp. URHB0036 TaxID=1298863 RepID=UPI00042582A8|nr:oligosaccharide flippase family protein [Marmoricola sp. URHB0036]